MKLTANGYPLDTSPTAYAELQDSSDMLGDAAALRNRMHDSGYLFFRRLLELDLVQQARLEILQKYAVLGEIDDRQPLDHAVAGDRGAVEHANLRAFSNSVRSGHWYLQVTGAPEVLSVHEALLEASIKIFDFRWPRLARPGEGCGFHCDGPYMARGTSLDRIFTSWIPLGDIKQHEGSLILLEGSHQNQSLREGYLSKDADKDGLVWMTDDPCELQQRYGKRWLTTDFARGDVLFFGMYMVHGALDNQSTTQRCRLSSDTRYQSQNEPADHRWNGLQDGQVEAHGGRRVFYPGLGKWRNADFSDEWKRIDEQGRLVMPTQNSAEHEPKSQ